MCDQEITIEDLKETMLSMCDNKSPGNDGLSREFYNYFWDDISDLYFEGLMDGKQKEELSTSQRQAIIKLLEKSDKDRSFIKIGDLYHY